MKRCIQNVKRFFAMVNAFLYKQSQGIGRKVREEKAAADAMHARQLGFLSRRSASRAISGAASVFVSEPTDLSTIDKEIE